MVLLCQGLPQGIGIYFMFEYVKNFFALLGLACFLVSMIIVLCALLSKLLNRRNSDTSTDLR